MLSTRLQEFEARSEPVNLSDAFPALTGDIIMDYFFGFNYGQLKHPEFDSFHEAFVKIGAVGHVGTQMPWIYPVSSLSHRRGIMLMIDVIAYGHDSG